MEEELNEQAIKLMDEIFPLGHDCAPIADENYPYIFHNCGKNCKY